MQLKVLLLIVKAANLVVNAHPACQVGIYTLIRPVFSIVQTDIMTIAVEFALTVTPIAHCAIAVIAFRAHQDTRLRLIIVGAGHVQLDIGMTPLLVAVTVIFIKEDKSP